MTLEPWVFRTGLMLLALNCVNALLFWIAHNQQRRWQAGHLHGQNARSSNTSPRAANPGYLPTKIRLGFRRAAAPARAVRPLPVVSSAGLSPRSRQAAAATE